ncbi:MAG TPA: ABC transporter permease, partial [Gemmatimonadaceae bacterium]|nr:ABC transporter permease [Gemmatimonadaceae bacterium]
MESVLRDIRYGIRSLLKSPGLTFVATLALTLGIGLSTTMYSIVHGILLGGLPFPHGDRIVAIARSDPARHEDRVDMPLAEYEDYRTRATSFAKIAATTCCSMNVSGVGQPERYTGTWATASFFEIVAVKPILGRVILPGEDTPNGARSVVLGYAMWQNRFGGDPKVLGTSIRVNGEPYTIVGVMPEGFDFPDGGRLWIPMQDDPLKGKRQDQRGVQVMGVLKPGVTRAQAAAQVAAIAKDLAQEYKASNEGIVATVTQWVDGQLGPQPRALLWSMLGAVMLVLLIACANVTNLLLDRAAHRTKEVGIRSALGASRAAVVRQFLTESFVLSALGAVLGTAVAFGGVVWFNRALVETEQVAGWIDIRVSPAVLVFVAALALLSTLFSGIIPAVQASRADINEVLKDESRGTSSLHIGRMSRALVVFEIALSCGLLVTSGLMIKSVTKLNNMDTGFRTSNILTARMAFQVTYTDTLKQARFYDQLRQRLTALPGVRNVSIESALPGVGGDGTRMEVEGTAYAAESDV